MNYAHFYNMNSRTFPTRILRKTPYESCCVMIKDRIDSIKLCISNRNIQKIVWIQAIMNSSLVQPDARLSPLISNKQENVYTRSRDSLMTRPLNIEWLSACRRFTETADGWTRLYWTLAYEYIRLQKISKLFVLFNIWLFSRCS